MIIRSTVTRKRARSRPTPLLVLPLSLIILSSNLSHSSSKTAVALVIWGGLFWLSSIRCEPSSPYRQRLIQSVRNWDQRLGIYAQDALTSAFLNPSCNLNFT
ncbi:hypothetical protein L873DRAFT_232398 [Choiromyces venosus 120613-1]|uniref:Uncharacterized protein n=1 Tax=Choiromyces venosus 120613-1 TaxID=1336337 RepID=A0A3N4JY89_9PEZI|nr:hypothetical protein L873DRAFT_232398 [Choiromyces venosus 120613-1]